MKVSNHAQKRFARRHYKRTKLVLNNPRKTILRLLKNADECYIPPEEARKYTIDTKYFVRDHWVFIIRDETVITVMDNKVWDKNLRLKCSENVLRANSPKDSGKR